MNDVQVLLIIILCLSVGGLVGFAVSDAYVFQPFKSQATIEFANLNNDALMVIKDYNHALNNCVSYAQQLEGALQQKEAKP